MKTKEVIIAFTVDEDTDAQKFHDALTSAIANTIDDSYGETVMEKYQDSRIIQED